MKPNALPNFIHKRLRREDGQVAMETLVVFVPFFIVTMFFFSMMFILATLMLTQAKVNRAALQISALGCLPNLTDSDPNNSAPGYFTNLKSTSALATQSVSLNAVTPPFAGPATDGTSTDYNWDRTYVIDTSGSNKGKIKTQVLLNDPANPALYRPIPNCSTRQERVPPGRYIYVQGVWNLQLSFFGLTKKTVPFVVSALILSNSLESSAGT